MKRKKPFELVFSRREFCGRNKLSKYMYRRLLGRGLAPKGHKMGSKSFITREEEREFRKLLTEGKLAVHGNENDNEKKEKKKKKKRGLLG